jgi:hypothetical protein
LKEKETGKKKKKKRGPPWPVWGWPDHPRGQWGGSATPKSQRTKIKNKK